MCSIIGTLAIGIIGLGWLQVSGRSRVPSPPARITAFTGRPTDRCSAAASPSPAAPSRQRLPRRAGRRARRRSSRGPRPGIAAIHASVDDRCADAERASGRRGTAGRRTSARGCPALPAHCTSMRRAPSAASAMAAPADDDLAGRGRRQRPTPGTEPVDRGWPPTPTKNSSRSATGSRILPTRDLVEVAGDVAVDPVGGAERRRAGPPRARVALVGRAGARGRPAGRPAARG